MRLSPCENHKYECKWCDAVRIDLRTDKARPHQYVRSVSLMVLEQFGHTENKNNKYYISTKIYTVLYN